MTKPLSHYSLRHRLLAWISIPIIAVMLMALASSYHFTKEEIAEVYDAQLVHSAKVLLQLTEHEIMEDEDFHLGIENHDLQHRYERNLGFRIWVRNELITHSPNTAHFGTFEASPGFSNHNLDGHQWRFFVFLAPEQNIKIEVSERMDIRAELIIQLMVSLIAPAFLFLPLVLLIIWGGIRQVLKPVIRISTDVDERSSDDLSPLQQHALPQEIAPLVNALNRLFKRLETSFKSEREFTDHAAHELRTPLAAMKTQTQVLIKKAAEVPACAAGLENLQSSINRATRLITQLLSLARLQNENLPKEDTDLSEVLQDCVTDITSVADHKQVHIKTDIAANCIIHAHTDSVRILINNLLDNAVKYTPAQGDVSVTLHKNGTLRIVDTGCGISDKNKARVFERFVRTDKSGQSGSGLGLSIAQWIADTHDVTITLSDNVPQGLKAEIKWTPLSV